jgi:hypothetical protein
MFWVARGHIYEKKTVGRVPTLQERMWATPDGSDPASQLLARAAKIAPSCTLRADILRHFSTALIAQGRTEEAYSALTEAVQLIREYGSYDQTPEIAAMSCCRALKILGKQQDAIEVAGWVENSSFKSNAAAYLEAIASPFNEGGSQQPNDEEHDRLAACSTRIEDIRNSEHPKRFIGVDGPCGWFTFHNAAKIDKARLGMLYFALYRSHHKRQ